jgi:cobalt-zinc-cadmium efflux system membrane fusion protein
MMIEAQSAARAASSRNRLWLAGSGALAVLALIGGVWMLNSGQGNAVARPEKAARDADGAFGRARRSGRASSLHRSARSPSATSGRPTARSRLTRTPTTPVFSPYSGRVSRLIARPGEHVERGAPLFAIEASEFVQGQNDLVTAVAGVEKAKSKLALAQQIEKRQRELLAIRGGALKDLEQAQSDLVTAQGDMRSAEIALAADAQPAAHPRPLRRGDRAARRRSTASAARPSSPRRSAAR